MVNQQKNSKENTRKNLGGRPKGEPSKTIRVPMALVEAVKSMIRNYRQAKKTSKN